MRTENEKFIATVALQLVFAHCCYDHKDEIKIEQDWADEWLYFGYSLISGDTYLKMIGLL